MNKMYMQMKWIKNLLAVSLASALVVACDRQEESHEDIVKADLLVIIDSMGSPCEQVIDYESSEELAYSISCKSGHRYLISVNPQGRVDIQNKE